MTIETDSVIRWLLEGDAAIRWQTMRDLAGADKAQVERERRLIARNGWGAAPLARQDANGMLGPGMRHTLSDQFCNHSSQLHRVAPERHRARILC